MRGALVGGAHCLLPFGLIPARAGSTKFNLTLRRCLRAHPRPCGEHSILALPGLVEQGSSPPVRGARYTFFRGKRNGGLIPARAGSTMARSCTGMSCWAHPRPCGEHVRSGSGISTPRGSSPPVRGALVVGGVFPLVGGLIPARAGSTGSTFVSTQLRRAHPRPCGEHIYDVATGVLREGSSPPVRGAQVQAGLVDGVAGLIPARAGSTRGVIGHIYFSGAHPRPCGEHCGGNRERP